VICVTDGVAKNAGLGIAGLDNDGLKQQDKRLFQYGSQEAGSVKYDDDGPLFTDWFSRLTVKGRGAEKTQDRKMRNQ